MKDTVIVKAGVPEKRCATCLAVKAADAFYLNSRYKHGLSSSCQLCSRAAMRKLAEQNRRAKYERLKAWRKQNPEKARAQSRRNNERRKHLKVEPREETA